MHKMINDMRPLSQDEMVTVSGAAVQVPLAAAAIWFAGFASGNIIDSLLDNYDSGIEVKNGSIYVGGRKFG